MYNRIKVRTSKDPNSQPHLQFLISFFFLKIVSFDYFRSDPGRVYNTYTVIRPGENSNNFPLISKAFIEPLKSVIEGNVPEEVYALKIKWPSKFLIYWCRLA
jgi:hypothetical protein